MLLTLRYGFFPRAPFRNAHGRYAPVRAPVDDHATGTGPCHEDTGDQAFCDGHHYSDRPPGSGPLAVPSDLLLTRAASTRASRPAPAAR